MDQQIAMRCEEEARKYNVRGHIHDQDLLFKHICSVFPSDPVKEYFSDARNSAEKLRNILYGQLGLTDKPFSLLDFASGYGMVARHYPSVFSSHVTIATSDIHPEANAFNAEHLGLKTYQSTTLPEQLNFDQTFDVVFCLSFFSHISHEYFLRWLRRLYNFVNEGGFLIFTTHGRFSKFPFNQPMQEDNIYFLPSSEQGDLDSNLYGSSWAVPTYVLKAINQTDPRGPSKARVAFFSEAYWWGHQDIYAVAKL